MEFWSTFVTFINNRFKLFLEPMALRDSDAVDPRLPRLPVCACLSFNATCLIYFQPGKQAIDLIIDFLSALWEYAKEQITREIGTVADLSAFSCSTSNALG
jgi:hypothetical protein